MPSYLNRGQVLTPVWTYRGVSVSTGKWVFGHLEIDGDLSEPERTIVRVGGEVVLPESLGINTGRQYATGQPVFTGDLVVFIGVHSEGNIPRVVCYNQHSTRFEYQNPQLQSRALCDYYPEDNVQYLGTVFENPEIIPDFTEEGESFYA